MSSVEITERTAETTNPIQGIIVRTWFRHYHTFVSLRVESNGNILVITFLIIRRDLLDKHLADFAFFPVSDVVKGVVHTIRTLSGARTLPNFGNVKVGTTEHRTIDNLE